MLLDEFKEKVFSKAKAQGFTEYELYYVDGNSFRVNIYRKEIDQYSINSYIGLSFRGIYNGKMGYSYTEILDDNSVEGLISGAKENAEVIDNEDTEVIYGGGGEYKKVIGYNEELSHVGVEDKIKLALELEDKTSKYSQNVKSVKSCAVVTGQGTNRIINSKGIDLEFRSNIAYAVTVPVAEKNGELKTGDAFIATNKFEEIDTESLAKESVEKALAYMGAEAIESGKYRIVIKNEVMADLLDTFGGIFSAYNVQKGLSLLKDKIGEKIASESLTIIDDPLYKDGLSSCPFDAEGVPAYTKEVVKAGKLMTLLYNLKTAIKDGVNTTGNASKDSFISPIGISPFNFYIKPGEKAFEEMLKDLQEGLLITSLEGLHSGANAVSGDFSLAAKGFKIKAGGIERPVDQITVAGNFYELLLNVEQIGADLKFGMPSGSSCFGSPSVMIKELSVSGK